MSHRRDVLSQLACADRQHAVFGTESVDLRLSIDHQLGWSIRRRERHDTVNQTHDPLHLAAGLQSSEQFCQQFGVGLKLQ